MKKIFLFFAIVLIISSCMPGQGGAGLLPLKVDFKKGEKFVYGIYKDNKIGEAKISLKEGGEIHQVVKEKDKEVIKKEKTIVFQSIFSLPNKSVESKVLLYKKNFLPISHYKIIKNKKDDIIIYAEYLPKFMKIKLKGKNRNKEIAIETLDNSYDNETILFALRYLKFSELFDKELSANVEVPQIASSALVKIKADEDKEEIEINSGKFTCYKLTITVDNKEYHTAYYTIEKPNYLVKYQNDRETYLLEKIEEEEGNGK